VAERALGRAKFPMGMDEAREQSPLRLVLNECLEKFRRPYPGRFACTLLYYAYYDRNF
jgi:hypothetical protein